MPSPDESLVERFSSCALPTEFGVFQVVVYRCAGDHEHMLIHVGELAGGSPPFVRIHSECYTGEVLGSLKCDCRDQLQNAMREIQARGRGAILYLRQEGRGIGLGNKILAYAEQDKGADTIEANEILGFPVDLREYSVAAAILKAHGVRSVRLNTNNPEKVAALQREQIHIAEVVPSVSHANPHNEGYLRTKYEGLGHKGLEPAVRHLDRSG